MKRLPWAAVALVALAAPLRAAELHPAVIEAENERIAVMAKARPTVLAIFSPVGEGGGSGVVISPDGYALTNFHVAQPSGKAMKCGMADGTAYDAVIVGIDPVGDVALIKLFGRDDFPAAELGDSDQVRQGDACFAMGNPFLLATDFQPTATFGIVSGVHRYQEPAGTLLEYADCLQTDASINPGNSGGPLFDMQGRVIGINGRASFEKRGRVNVGAAYAISINQIKKFMGHLRAGRIVDHATLGARVVSDDQRRAFVSDILEESDAWRRGLRYGDDIVAFGGRPVDTANAFKNVLGTFPKGWRTSIVFQREGKRQEALVRLAGVHSDQELLEKTTGRAKPAMPMPKPGDKPGEKPREKPDKKPAPREPHDDGPAPHPLRALRAAPPPMPEIVKKHFEERRGYANYFFNRLHRDRVWKAWMAKSLLPAGPWTLAGPLEGGGEYRIEVTDAAATLHLPHGDSRWESADEIASSLLPEGSGGLLPALFLLRRLALGPDQFGEVYYLGTVPFPGSPRLADVLVGVHAGVECHFYFDDQGLLLGLELFSSDGVDPGELRFSGHREVDGQWVPAQFEALWGDIRFARFPIARFPKK